MSLLGYAQESRKSDSYYFISTWPLEVRKTDDQTSLTFSKLFILFKLDSNLKFPLKRKEPHLAICSVGSGIPSNLLMLVYKLTKVKEKKNLSSMFGDGGVGQFICKV